MKRGTKILFSIGLGWSLLLPVLFYNGSLQEKWLTERTVIGILFVAGLWTVLGLIYVLVYGWRE
jgi:hypothetical protein